MVKAIRRAGFNSNKISSCHHTSLARIASVMNIDAYHKVEGWMHARKKEGKRMHGWMDGWRMRDTNTSHIEKVLRPKIIFCYGLK